MQRSLQQWQGDPVSIAYKPFFLDPTIPAEGVDFLPYMQKKGGGNIAPEQFFDGPRQMGLQSGLIFNFTDIPKAPNTLLAHTLIALAPKDKQEALIEAIYDAFFEHGQDVGDRETLLKLAEAMGLNRDEIARGLTDTTIQAQVKAEAQQAQQLGVSGVPFFVINQKYAFSGAQPPETMTRILEQVASMKR